MIIYKWKVKLNERNFEPFSLARWFGYPNPYLHFLPPFSMVKKKKGSSNDHCHIGITSFLSFCSVDRFTPFGMGIPESLARYYYSFGRDFPAGDTRSLRKR